MNGAGKFLFFSFFFLFSFDEYYYEEKMGWNDLAFLSFFFLLLSFFFLVLGAQGGRIGWESFFLAAAERKGKKENRTHTEQDSHQTMTAMTAMEGTCRLAARRMEIRPKVSRVEMKRDEMR